MFQPGEKIVYGTTGVCIVQEVTPRDDLPGTAPGTLYYALEPLSGSGVIYLPVDAPVFMRPVITRQEAEALLKDTALAGCFLGTEDRVTGQLPAAGGRIPENGQVLVYLGQKPEQEAVNVPDFAGMTRQQASDAAGALGLYILVSGNPSVEQTVIVTAQSIAPGTEVTVGTTIRLEFTDTQIRD